MIKKEEWKNIPGCAGKYLISNKGKVKSLAGKRHGNNGHIICLEKNKKGYLYFRPTINKKRQGIVSVHRTVASVFIGPKPFLNTQLDHVDGNKENNCVSNLEYVTPDENVRRYFRLKPGKMGVHYMKNSNGRKKWRARITINGLGRVLLSDHHSRDDAYRSYYETYKEWFGVVPW